MSWPSILNLTSSPYIHSLNKNNKRVVLGRLSICQWSSARLEGSLNFERASFLKVQRTIKSKERERERASHLENVDFAIWQSGWTWEPHKVNLAKYSSKHYFITHIIIVDIIHYLSPISICSQSLVMQSLFSIFFGVKFCKISTWKIVFQLIQWNFNGKNGPNSPYFYDKFQ